MVNFLFFWQEAGSDTPVHDYGRVGRETTSTEYKYGVMGLPVQLRWLPTRPRLNTTAACSKSTQSMNLLKMARAKNKLLGADNDQPYQGLSQVFRARFDKMQPVQTSGYGFTFASIPSNN